MLHVLIHLRTPTGIEPAFAAIEFDDIEHAYLDICAAIPDTAAEMLRRSCDPMACAYLICDVEGNLLETVPFTDVLRPEIGVGRPIVAPDRGGDSVRRASRAVERSRRVCAHAIELCESADAIVSRHDALRVALTNRIAASSRPA